MMEHDFDTPADNEITENTDAADHASLGAGDHEGDDLTQAKAALAKAKSKAGGAKAKSKAELANQSSAKKSPRKASGAKKAKRSSDDSGAPAEVSVDLDELVASGVEVPSTRDRFSDAGSDLDHVPGLHGESVADGVGQALQWNASSLDFVEYEASITAAAAEEEMQAGDNDAEELSPADLIARELGHDMTVDEDEAIEQTLESSEQIVRELAGAGARDAGDDQGILTTDGVDETLHLPSMEQMGFATLGEDEGDSAGMSAGDTPPLQAGDTPRHVAGDTPRHVAGDTPDSINDQAFAAAGSMDESMLASAMIAHDFGDLAGDTSLDVANPDQMEFPQDSADDDTDTRASSTDGESIDAASANDASEDQEDPADNDADPQATEFIEADHVISIIESLLFSTEKPVSIATIKQIFKGTNVRTKDITRGLDILASDYASSTRGVTLEEINGGFQLRTKVDNSEYLRRLQKTRPFRLSGPALEVMSIVAYKQPVTKHEIDEIRGVESGHLLRALMERGMVNFAGKSDLPGKPMAYGSTRKFLETFGLRNLKELPTLSEIDEILPQGIGEVEEKEKLSDITGQLTNDMMPVSYSEGEDELEQINDELLAIDTTSEFFEQEKVRERERRDRDRAQDIREKIMMGDDVEEKDRRWLDRFEAKLQAIETAAAAGTPITIAHENGEAAPQIGNELEALSSGTSEASGDTADRETGERSDAELIDNLNTGADETETEEADLLDDLEANLDWDEDEEDEASPMTDAAADDDLDEMDMSEETEPGSDLDSDPEL